MEGHDGLSEDAAWPSLDSAADVLIAEHDNNAEDAGSSSSLPGYVVKVAPGYTSSSLCVPVRLRVSDKPAATSTKPAKPPQTIPRFFHEKCQSFSSSPALVYERLVEVVEPPTALPNKSKESDPLAGLVPAPTIIKEWTTVTYGEYEQHVQHAALLLQHAGLQPRTTLAIWMTYNCPEWYYAELGALRAGGVVAGIYPTSSTDAVHHIVATSEASVCVVQNAQQMLKLRAMRERLPHLRAVLQISGPFDEFVGREQGYHRWSDLWDRPSADEEFEELLRREADIGANECAMLIYTSGTVGMPKAVMLSHDSIINDARAVSSAMPGVVPQAERTVTYLPLSHIAAQIFDIFMTIDNGVCVYFADENALKGTLVRTLVKARPTRMFGVPRIFEKIQEKLVGAESKASCLQRFLLQKARHAMLCYHLNKIENRKPSTFGRWWAAKVIHQIKVNLGLDQCKSLIVGGAPITDELKRIFLGLDMPLNDVYGLSECGGAVSMHIPLEDLVSVGHVFEGIEVKIYQPNEQGHGEICIRSRSNMMGYLNNPEKTHETITEDGWVYSGDLGYIHANGCLVVSGRIKELIITSGGENIPPVHIEEYVLREMPFVSNAMVVGDRRKYLNVLLTLKTEEDHNGLPLDTLRPETITWLRTLNLDFNSLSEVLNTPTADPKQLDELSDTLEVRPHPSVIDAIEEALKRANANALSNAQRLQKFALLPHDFSVTTGELGPTLKIRRNIVLEKYAKVIERMYD